MKHFRLKISDWRFENALIGRRLRPKFFGISVMPLSPWNRKKPELKENDAVTHNSVFAAANIDKMPIPIPIRVGIFAVPEFLKV